MKDICFVAQPFDGYMFDARYKEIIKPTVESCGLECYRVDEDYSVDVPVNTMVERISKAALVIAEISTNNPNVWYELGFASALNKPIIMVCSDERIKPYPFDIQHKNILMYRTKSRKDFDSYEQNLRNAIRSRYTDAEDNYETRLLTDEEMVLLKLIARDQKDVHQITPEEKILRAKMDQDTIHDCLRSLTRGGYVEYIYSTEGGDTYIRVTEIAEKILSRR